MNKSKKSPLKWNKLSAVSISFNLSKMFSLKILKLTLNFIRLLTSSISKASKICRRKLISTNFLIFSKKKITAWSLEKTGFTWRKVSRSTKSTVFPRKPGDSPMLKNSTVIDHSGRKRTRRQGSVLTTLRPIRGNWYVDSV